jgi:manganese efflux pump family protein
MEWAALITWVLTAGGGFVLLTLWLKNGGMAQSERGKIRPPLIMSHFLLAATGLVLWIIYVVTDSDALAWIAFVLLAIVAALGLTMFAVWLRQRQGAAPAAGGPPAGRATAAGPRGEPAEQRFPVAIVGLHGVLAVTTVVLVFLTAIGVGD